MKVYIKDKAVRCEKCKHRIFGRMYVDKNGKHYCPECWESINKNDNN